MNLMDETDVKLLGKLLSDVNQQEQKTPGRREEKIKQEEINKEIVRRDMIKNKRIPARVLVLESAELYPKEM